MTDATRTEAMSTGVNDMTMKERAKQTANHVSIPKRCVVLVEAALLKFNLRQLLMTVKLAWDNAETLIIRVRSQINNGTIVEIIKDTVAGAENMMTKISRQRNCAVYVEAENIKLTPLLRSLLQLTP